MTALRNRVSDHLQSPLTRNGYALLLSSAITSVLGLGYWILAARVYSEGTLGRGAALVSAMLLVTSLATAGLKRSLIRFVPASGSSASMVVRRIYAVGLGVSLVAGVLFLTIFQRWTPGLPALDRSLLAPVVFLAGIAAWGIFVLQDAVLIGADRSTLVPITNTIFSVLKIALLVAGIWVFSAGWGIFASWAIPAVLVGVPVNLWLFRKGLRRLARPHEAKPPTIRELARFTSGEYVASLAWQAANYFTPLLVIALAGATANALYYVPAQIAYTFFLISSNVTDALVAEGALAQDGLASKVRRSASQTALILVPGVALTVLAAPLIMSMFGGGYTGDAATVLRLLSLAALPNALTTVVIAVAHVRQRMWIVVVLQSVMSALTLGLSWVLLGSHGVVGVAWAWLIAQLVTAVLAVAVALATEAPLRRAALGRLVARASHVRSRATRGRARKTLAAKLAILPEATLPSGSVHLLAYQHDLLVARAGTGADAVVVRLAAGRQGRRVIAAHRSQLRSVHADPQLGSVRALIPRALSADVGAGWLVETAADGIPMASLRGEARDRAVSAGLDALDRLHLDTARCVVVGDQLARLWIHDPVATVAAVVTKERAARGLAALHRRLAQELTGETATVACLHGDPSLDNLLVAPDGSVVTGMVDWESSTIGLPECDLTILMLSRRAADGGEMGDTILELLDDGWRADEQATSRLGTAWTLNPKVRPSTIVLLTWLTHIVANLEKTDRYRNNPWWIRRNVENVLAALDEDAAPADRPIADLASHEMRPLSDDDLEPVGAAAQRSPLSVSRLRLIILGITLAAWAAATADAPVALRMALVIGATVVVPAVVIGRCLGTPGPLIRGVIGTAGAVASTMLLAEVLLYSGLWSPVLWLVAVGAATLALSLRIPPYQPTRPTPPTPADAIVRRSRSLKALR